MMKISNSGSMPSSNLITILVRYWSPVIFLAALLLHWTAVNDLEALTAVLIALALSMLPCMFFAHILIRGQAKAALPLFLFFTAIYFLIAGFSRAAATYFNEANEIYQNASDAWTIYLLSSQKFVFDAETLSRLTDTGTSITIFSQFYRVADYLGLPLSPGIGLSVNVALVALGATIGVAGAMRAFPSDPSIWRVALFLFASSGIAFLFAGHHLRDSYVFLLSSIIFYLLLCTDDSKLFTNFIPISIFSIIIVYIMTYFRAESVFVLFGFAAALIIDYILQRQLLAKVIFFSIFSAFGLYMIFVLREVFADQIEATSIVYNTEIGQSGGLAAELIFNQNVFLRLILGSLYLILINIPFYIGFTYNESFYWLVALQAFQAIFVLPAFIFTFYKILTSNEEKNIRGLRKIAVFYVGMLAVVSLTTLGYRHIGQFLPCLYFLASYGYVRSNKFFKMAGFLVIAMALPAAWLAIRI